MTAGEYTQVAFEGKRIRLDLSSRWEEMLNGMCLGVHLTLHKTAFKNLFF